MGMQGEEYLVPGQIVITVKAGWDAFDVKLDLVEVDGTDEEAFCKYIADGESEGSYELTIPMAAVQYTTWSATKNRS